MFLGSTFLVPVTALCVWAFLAYWFGRSQFERVLRFDAGAAQARTVRPDSSRRRSLTDLFFRLPGTLWRDPLGGLVEKELRSLARTPRFRMVFVMAFTFGVIVWLPMAINKGSKEPGFMSHYFLLFVCLYALTLIGQVTYWNCFGFDRSAIVFYYAAPQPMRLVLIAKNLAVMTYLMVDILLLNIVVALLHLTGGWQQALETMVVVLTCSLYLLAMGNLASVNYPRAINPERVSHGGGGGKMQGLLILFYPLALLPVMLAYLARWTLDSQIAFDAVLVLAVVIGGVVYWLALSSAVDSADRKREKLIVELSKNDGPIVAE
jgi:ABC-2 type transport system permease protein